MSRKQAYQDFVDRYQAGGDPMLSLNCPHCQGSILTVPAPAGETWDTLSTCPHCGGIYFKVVTDTVASGTAGEH